MPDDRAPVTPGSERAAGEAAAAAGPPATAPPPAAAGAPPTTTPSSAEASSTTPPPGPSAPAAAPPPARPGRARGRSIAAALAAAAVVLAALAVAVRTGEENVITGPPPPPALADAVPFDGRSPREPAAEGTRVLVALPRPALGATTIRDTAKQRRYVASLKDESRALRSALGARGVQLSRVVTFERTFDGFAATVRTRDLARLDSLGVRVRPVRRFYPATSEPVRIPGVRVPGGALPAAGGVPVAVLASGVDRRHPLLKDRLDRGRDVLETDDDPSP